MTLMEYGRIGYSTRKIDITTIGEGGVDYITSIDMVSSSAPLPKYILILSSNIESDSLNSGHAITIVVIMLSLLLCHMDVTIDQ